MAVAVRFIGSPPRPRQAYSQGGPPWVEAIDSHQTPPIDLLRNASGHVCRGLSCSAGGYDAAHWPSLYGSLRRCLHSGDPLNGSRVERSTRLLSRTAEFAGVIGPSRAWAVSDSVIDTSGREHYLVPLPGLSSTSYLHHPVWPIHRHLCMIPSAFPIAVSVTQCSDKCSCSRTKDLILAPHCLDPFITEFFQKTQSRPHTELGII